MESLVLWNLSPMENRPYGIPALWKSAPARPRRGAAPPSTLRGKPQASRSGCSPTRRGVAGVCHPLWLSGAGAVAVASQPVSPLSRPARARTALPASPHCGDGTARGAGPGAQRPLAARAGTAALCSPLGDTGRTLGCTRRSPGSTERAPGYTGRAPGYTGRTPGYTGRGP